MVLFTSSFQLTHENEELNQHLSASRENQLKLKSEARHLNTCSKVMWSLFLSHWVDVDRAVNLKQLECLVKHRSRKRNRRVEEVQWVS